MFGPQLDEHPAMNSRVVTVVRTMEMYFCGRCFDEAPEQAAVEEACQKMLKYRNFRALPQRCPRRWPIPYVSTRREWRDIEVL